MTIPRAIVCCSLFPLLVSCSLLRQETSQQNIDESCRQFVQEFYDWYVPTALRDNGVPAWDLALRDKRQAFSPELFRQLSADSAAQAKAVGDLVGLDFDPFLNCQDCGQRYLAENITRRDGAYWAEVHGEWSGKKNEKPDIVAELMVQDGRWFFVNFHYPNASRPEFENLLSQLKSLREFR